LGTSEFEEYKNSKQSPSGFSTNEDGSWAITTHKTGVELRVALKESANEVKISHLGNMALRAEENGMDIEDILTDEGVPVAEALTQDLPQILAHDFSGLAGLAAKDSFIDFRTGVKHKKVSNFITQIGAIGASSMVVAVGADTLVSGRLNSYTLAGTLVMSFYYAYLQQHVTRKYLGNANRNDAVIQLEADAHAVKILGDIHYSYCKNHFNLVAEAMLNGFDDEQTEEFDS
jgi:hypothetical protein